MSSKIIKVGNVLIGGGHPVSIQSMTTTKTEDVASTVAQIKRLEALKCEIIRVAVPNMESAIAIKEIKKQIDIPLVADIHFDYRLALESVKSGADKIRINPGNIGTDDRVKQVIEAVKEADIPIRIGVNSGSCHPKFLKQFGGPTADALVESALFHANLAEKFGYSKIAISLKSTSVVSMVEAYRKIAKIVDYPLHLGVTEAGTAFHSAIRSAMGIGSLLMEGIGDTIRVSVTGEPEEEIPIAKEILSAAQVRQVGMKIISCPTCGRCQINLIDLAKKVEDEFKDIDTPLTIAVMGCPVNGPGEAKEADLGLAGGVDEVLVFKKGKIINRVRYEDALNVLREEITKITQ